MANIARARFKKLADGIRQRMQSVSAESLHEETVNSSGSPAKVVRLKSPENKKVAAPYLFDEDDIKVSATHIEFGKYTYILKYLAAIKRSEKIPSRKECQLAIAFTIVALLALLIYIFIGQLKFGFAAVVYLSLGLLAFLISSIVCKQMKASYTLKFNNAQGELIKSVTSRDKKFILRLEDAVKKAISLSIVDDA